MRTEIREALESAGSPLGGTAHRYMSAGTVRAVVYRFLQEVESDVTVAELCDELCNGSSQTPDDDE
jgi:hypothetical protein